MTEYDYSPGAMQAYLAKQEKIGKWASNTSRHHERHGHPNPFTPSDTPRHSDYYAKPSTPSEIYGPDRPPSPPRSAPAYGYGGGYGYGGYGYGGGGGGYNAGYTSGQGTSNQLQPTWNGRAWVYNLTPQPQPQVQRRQSTSGSRRDKHSDRHRRSSSHRDRRRSVSSPASPSYGFNYPPVSAPPVQSYEVGGMRLSIHNAGSQPHLPSQQLLRPQPLRSSSLVSAQVLYGGYVQQQPLASPPVAYGSGAPGVVIVDGARRKSGKLRKGRY